MKKALVVSVSFSIVLLMTVLYLLSSMRNPVKNNFVQAEEPKEDKKSCCVEQTNGDVSDNSIYQLNSEWTTESGKKLFLRYFKGKKQILAMVFTTCTYACPLIVNDLKNIEAQIKQKEVSFILISIDPKRDTPEALRKYAENNKLDLKKWKLLTANEASVSELAAVLGFKYKQEPDGSFSHSNIINVLNENGEVAYQHFGLNQDVKDVLDNIYK